jgi:uroporphyrinogen-III synthase
MRAKATHCRNTDETCAADTGAVTAPLSGYTIGVTADRRSDEQIKLLAGRGAECLHGPVIKTHPVGADAAIGDATELIADDPPDVVVLTTGLGVRGWLEAADAVHLGDRLRTVLASSQLFARGPKANGALVTAGFDGAWCAPHARYDDIVDALATRGVGGLRVAVQLDGAGAASLCERIESLGATVVRIPVYRWSLPADTGPAERLIRATVDRRVDAVTFTAKPAVDNFFEIAAHMGVDDDLDEAIRTDVAMVCVGPVCATGFTDLGFDQPLVPERHRLGALVQLVATHFEGQARTIRLGGTPVRIQGRTVCVDGTDPVSLTERERALLGALLERPGVVSSKRDLLKSVWRGAESDEHLVEVTIARLRQRLGPAGHGIETVMRRGYRLSEV